MRTVAPHAGFSLIELMVTIAVLAVLLGIAIPSFQSMLEKQRLVGAAEQLYEDLQYARTEAIKRNANVFVSFTTGSNWCYGIALATCTCGTAGSCQLSGVDKVVSGTDFRGVSLESNFGGSTRFEPRRGTVPGGNGTATLSSNYGSIKIIVGSLGRVRICSDSASLTKYKPSSGSC
ncbi:MAG: GspH/FimT family pseudopilin [Gammaproteobacteria bacterium]|nr:GspH/FimT family pseudopilin [Gammaproteobacteria bacterium]